VAVQIPPEGTQGFSHPPLSGNCAPLCGFTFFPDENRFRWGCSRGCSKRVFKGVLKEGVQRGSDSREWVGAPGLQAARRLVARCRQKAPRASAACASSSAARCAVNSTCTTTSKGESFESISLKTVFHVRQRQRRQVRRGQHLRPGHKQPIRVHNL